ncbi:hypothetical protein OIU77_001335 [Salix suchowensis]|uniref:Uncharacterized protein n=1 Tax=Salix suchowensis TaxID=1278906 RepID=A0ABQ9B197_9ROSI|nr:hypothetical protein OIU77_001335 [Salix suchowensis]
MRCDPQYIIRKIFLTHLLEIWISIKVVENKSYTAQHKMQNYKATASLAASNTKGNKLKDIHPNDTNLSNVSWTGS